MAARSHQLTGVRVGLAFEQERGDTTLESVDLGGVRRVVVIGRGGQAGDVSRTPSAKVTRTLRSVSSAIASASVDAELAQRLGAVLRAFGSAASYPLRRERICFVVGATGLECLRHRVQPRVHVSLELAQRLL
jgi:hypothetical protein